MEDRSDRNRPRVLFCGRTTLDVLYWLDRLPEEDTKAYARRFHAAPGGPAVNAAVTHALLGGEAMLVSAVGGGPWAGVVHAELDRLGIRLLDLAVGTAYETPLTTVLVSAESSSRTIVNPPISEVALAPLAASWEQAVPSSWGAVPPVILTDGFHLPKTLGFLAACRAAGAMLCLDGGSWKPGTAEVAPLLTAAIVGERFAIPGEQAAPEAVLDWFARHGVPMAAVTRGPRPILAVERGRRFEVEVEQVAAVDTTGAGDVLHGAFCHMFARGVEFEAALRRAAEIATRSCRSLGVQSWLAEANER